MQAGISKGGPQPTVPSVLLPEILSFSPHFLLDDIVNIANHAVGDTVDAMEKFIVRWADERTSEEWDSTQDLEQGLVAFQTLLEFHTDIAFDFFEAWSLRNIFAIPADLPIVVPHQAGLDLEQSPGKEAELLGEIEELRRKIDNSRRLERLYSRAVRTSARQADKSQRRLDRLSFLQNPQLQALETLSQKLSDLFASMSAQPDLDFSNTDLPIQDPGKRTWETGKAGYIGWAVAQLIARSKRADAKDGEENAAVGAIVGETERVAKTEHVKGALEAARDAAGSSSMDVNA
ncbi:hypothetical protein EWM64_g1699 [Hericium alpestre]|uniref:Mis12-domain-containing protein n=1 Tax=Hericium alpestre TaxID=135208 RepID=A0A4Z0A7Q8_9AGAM|nr:hypothetical protein EWM64_g1699 [Hericium alpestre]